MKEFASHILTCLLTVLVCFLLFRGCDEDRGDVLPAEVRIDTVILPHYVLLRQIDVNRVVHRVNLRLLDYQPHGVLYRPGHFRGLIDSHGISDIHSVGSHHDMFLWRLFSAIAALCEKEAGE